MHGIQDSPPGWLVPDSEPDSLRDEDFVRYRHLALTQIESDGKYSRIPGEIRLLEKGGDSTVAFYSLIVGNLEIVWSDRSPDVLLFDTESEKITDEFDASEVYYLARCLGSQVCEIYDPDTHHVDDSGELVSNRSMFQLFVATVTQLGLKAFDSIVEAYAVSR